MKTLILTLGLLLPAVASASEFGDVLRVQDFLLGTAPNQRAAIRLCVSEDGSCDRLGFPVENQEQVAISSDTPFHNVAGRVIQGSTQPRDNRAIACWDAMAQGAVMQACAYGTNYPDSLSGIPLAGKAKFVGYNGTVFGTYSGQVYVVANSEHVASFSQRGFGFGGLARSGRNTFSMGWGQLPDTVDDGEIAFAAVRTGATMHLWFRLSDGTTGCLTCPRE
jgi:hypothetical protein